MKINKFLLIFTSILIIYVFYPIFVSPIVAGGDYISPQYQYYLSIFYPFAAWDPTFGLGWGIGPLLHYAPMDIIIRLVFSISKVFADRIVWWGLFILLSYFGAVYLSWMILGKGKNILLGSLIFIFNTYILMILVGGQIAGIGLAYAALPFTIGSFLALIFSLKKNTYPITSLVIYSFLLECITVLDLRIAYICIIATCILLLFSFLFQSSWKKFFRAFIITEIIPLIIVGLLNLYWIFPMLLFHQNPIQELGSAYNSQSSVKFFSFATFENSISLLHPNWPENIFGMVGFMRPEFLVIPIIAFASLLFLNHESKEQRMILLGFAVIGLIGAFLAKGANPPFGELYLWFFKIIPGFFMFRDPTKWYVLTILSYLVLIPFTLLKIYQWLQKRLWNNNSHTKNINKYPIFNLQNLLILCFILFWIFTVRQAIFSKLGGTFKIQQMPVEYVKLKTYLNEQHPFFRTFWIPTTQRFGYNSIKHPSVSASNLYNQSSNSALLKELNKNKTESLLQKMSVKYVIIPYDSQGEIFVKNRKYDNALYNSTVRDVSSIPWLRKVKGFGKIVVFQVPNPKGHFWLTGNGKITFNFINPSKYSLHLTNVKRGEKVVFSEAFDPYWEMIASNSSVKSLAFENRLNSFLLPESGSYTVSVYYTPQKWVDIGLIISSISFILLFVTFAYSLKK